MTSSSSHHLHRFPVFCGTVEVIFEEPTVLAARILDAAGAMPAEEFKLEALAGRGGRAVAEFSAADSVDLTVHERHYFRAVPRGGGRA